MADGAPRRDQAVERVMTRMFLLSKSYEDAEKGKTRLDNRIEAKLDTALREIATAEEIDALSKQKIKDRDKRLRCKAERVDQTFPVDELIPQLDWAWRATLDEQKEDVSGALKAALQGHPLWPFLEDLPGLRSAYVARLISIIDDPRRFPGVACSEGHIHSTVVAIGDPCPSTTIPERGADPEPCPGVIERQRPGTGTRAIWHYFGLHVLAVETGDGEVEHKLPNKYQLGRFSNKQADWHMQAQSLFLGDWGVAGQIKAQKPQPYESIYREKFAQKQNEGHPRPNRVAEVVVCKAFIADLLREWKRLEFGIGPGAVPPAERK